MIKKLISLVFILCIAVSLVSCSSKDEEEAVLADKWAGRYVWQDEETEEFKLLNIESIGEKKVHVECNSVRTVQSFDGEAKSKTGRYLAVNLGNKSLKVTLSANYDYVDIDDMWTGESPSDRMENWSGRYQKLDETMEVPKFGNASWNGTYICEECGQIVSVYGVKERYVLFVYESTDEEGQKVINRLNCLESDPKRAVYTKDERLVMIDIIKPNSKIEITDMYMDDMENKGISGIYTRYIPEKTDE